MVNIHLIKKIKMQNVAFSKALDIWERREVHAEYSRVGYTHPVVYLYKCVSPKYPQILDGLNEMHHVFYGMANNHCWFLFLFSSCFNSYTQSIIKFPSLPASLALRREITQNKEKRENFKQQAHLPSSYSMLDNVLSGSHYAVCSLQQPVR